ncbi:MAG: BlaI/MecI/CopY family transcriptional regulator [Deltaproteobacteria bacterium]|nr:BlaI/MecI/CopY family transcriptional regulator [Deltaproteobacteria bacterium]
MVKKIARNFRTSDNGPGGVLGSLEEAVMNALWASKAGLSGKEVRDEVGRTRDAALTTVLTVLERLVKKGLVVKSKGESVYVFTPALGKDEFEGRASREVIKGVMELWSSSAAASFVDILASRNPNELDKLAALIEEKKAGIKEGRK